MPRTPGITFQYENTLLVSRKKLQAAAISELQPEKTAVTAPELGALLRMGGVAAKITAQMDMMYNRTRERAVDPAKISRPALWLAQLSVAGESENSSVYDKNMEVLQGRIINNAGDRRSTALITNPAPLWPAFREYWDEVAATEFVPEIDHNGGFKDAGLWLRVRTEL